MSLLTVRRSARRVRRGERAPRHRARRRAGRGRRHARRQRGRQDHDDPLDLGNDRSAGDDHVRRRGHHDDACRNRSSAWASPRCPRAAARSRSSPSKRTCASAPTPARTRRSALDIDLWYETFPRLARTPQPAGRQPVRWRAADAGDRQGADEPAEAAALRRAEPRPRPADHEGAVQHHRRAQRPVGHRRAARRAERQPRHAHREARLPARDRQRSSPAATPRRSLATTASARPTWGTDDGTILRRSLHRRVIRGDLRAGGPRHRGGVPGERPPELRPGRDGDPVGLHRVARDDVDDPAHRREDPAVARRDHQHDLRLRDRCGGRAPDRPTALQALAARRVRRVDRGVPRHQRVRRRACGTRRRRS